MKKRAQNKNIWLGTSNWRRQYIM